MRRALLIVAVVVIAAGGSLVYFGTRDGHSHGQAEHLPRLPTTTSGPVGFAVGRMHVAGGPTRRNGTAGDTAIAGTIAVHRAGDATVLEKITVGPTGRFRIDLPVGVYQLVGRSSNFGDEIDSQSFTIRSGRTTSVDLVVIAT
jgi:hypothetical protein